MPAAAKILSVFICVLALTRLRVQLGLALMLGGVALQAWADKSFPEIAANMRDALCAPELWTFLLIMALILELGRDLTSGGNADRIIRATRRWGGRHGRAWSLMALPAMVGLVPMPGGALFSAPLVERAAESDTSESEWKSAVNYWFRHIWEYWWPLYPGVILAVGLFKLEWWRFIAVQIWFTPVAVLAGYFFLVRPHVRPADRDSVSDTGGNALSAFAPVAVVVGFLLVAPEAARRLMPGIASALGRMLELLAMAAGLAVAIIMIAIAGRAGSRRIFASAFTKSSLNVFCSVAGVLVFQSMLIGSDLLPVARCEFGGTGIPTVFIVVFLPFLAGLVTGLAFGFVGTSFPLVIELIGAGNNGLPALGSLVLAYAAGYMGMMISPVHICLIVTKDFFSASLTGTLRRILPCVLVIMLYAVAAHLALRLAGW